MSNKSPLAPDSFPDIPPIRGLRFASVASGERYQDRLDLVVAVIDQAGSSAGVFTQSTTPGAPVTWSREVLKQGKGRAVIINSGRANVCTGHQGRQITEIMAAAAAKQTGLSTEAVYVCSTGVIGQQPEVDKILAAIPSASALSEEGNWQSMAEAILTTDTFAKGAVAHCEIDGKPVTIAGIAKGSGMIQPNMATMLAYVFTDAAIPADVLQELLMQATEQSFNCVTVDSDTSTSDTCLLFATAQAGNSTPQSASDTTLAGFTQALDTVMQDLAQQVARDGEGASKFITVNVTGAESNQSAHTIAMSIANSPLLKTAIAGEDANWGRVIMAVGKAYEPIDFSRLSIAMGGILIAEGNGPVEGYDESLVTAHLQGKDIQIDVDVGLDNAGQARVWTCDLTHGYIDINADYRS